FAFLVGKTQLLQPEILSVTQQPQEVSRIVASRNDENVLDSRIHQCLKRVIEHRLVVHRQQVLVRYPGQWTQPRPRSTRQNHTLHRASYSCCWPAFYAGTKSVWSISIARDRWIKSNESTRRVRFFRRTMIPSIPASGPWTTRACLPTCK